MISTEGKLQRLFILALGSPIDAKQSLEIGEVIGKLGWSWAWGIVEEYFQLVGKATSHEQTLQLLVLNGFNIQYPIAELKSVADQIRAGNLSYAALLDGVVFGLPEGDLKKVLDAKTSAADAYNQTILSKGLANADDGAWAQSALQKIFASIGGDDVSKARGKLLLEEFGDALSESGIKLKIVDGYIAGADVFIDSDGDGVLDEGEYQTKSDGQGNASIPAGVKPGRVVISGGTDLFTGKPLTGQLRAPEGSVLVTPLTTLSEALIRSGNAKDLLVASQKVAAGLGLPKEVDLLTYDPLEVLSAGKASTAEKQSALIVLSMQQQVATAIAQISIAISSDAGNSTSSSPAGFEKSATDAVITSIAQKVASVTEPVNLRSSALIIESVSNAAKSIGKSLNAEQLSSISNIVAESNKLLDNAAKSGTLGEALTALSKTGAVVQGTLLDQMKSAGSSVLAPLTLSKLVNQFATDSIRTEIAGAPVGEISTGIKPISIPGSSAPSSASTNTVLSVNTGVSSASVSAPPPKFLKLIAPSVAANTTSTTWTVQRSSGDISWEYSVNGAAGPFVAGSGDSFSVPTGTYPAGRVVIRPLDGQIVDAGSSQLINTRFISISSGSAPTVDSVQTDNPGLFYQGQVVRFTVNFSEPVQVSFDGPLSADNSMRPRLALGLESATTRYAIYESGSGTSSLSFSYRVEFGDLDTNGLQVNSLQLPSGSAIKNAAGTPIAKSLAGKVSSTDGVKVNGAVIGASVDGYLINTQIFVDQDGDNVVDPGEAVGGSIGPGVFSIPSGAGRLIMRGGEDISTGQAFKVQYEAPEGYRVINPITTLIARLQGLDSAGNRAQPSLVTLKQPVTESEKENYDPSKPSFVPAVQGASGAIAQYPRSVTEATQKIVASGLFGSVGLLSGQQSALAEILKSYDAFNQVAGLTWDSSLWGSGLGGAISSKSAALSFQKQAAMLGSIASAGGQALETLFNALKVQSSPSVTTTETSIVIVEAVAKQIVSASTYSIGTKLSDPTHLDVILKQSLKTLGLSDEVIASASTKISKVAQVLASGASLIGAINLDTSGIGSSQGNPTESQLLELSNKALLSLREVVKVQQVLQGDIVWKALSEVIGGAAASIKVDDLLKQQGTNSLSDLVSKAVTGPLIPSRFLAKADLPDISGEAGLYEGARFTSSNQAGQSGSWNFTGEDRFIDIEVLREGGLDGTVVLRYDVFGSSTLSTSRFGGSALPTGTITFGPDETSRTIRLSLPNNQTPEPDELIRVQLTDVYGNSQFIDAQGKLTQLGDLRFNVIDDDPNRPTVVASAASDARASSEIFFPSFTVDYFDDDATLTASLEFSGAAPLAGLPGLAKDASNPNVWSVIKTDASGLKTFSLVELNDALEALSKISGVVVGSSASNSPLSATINLKVEAVGRDQTGQQSATVNLHYPPALLSQVASSVLAKTASPIGSLTLTDLDSPRLEVEIASATASMRVDEQLIKNLGVDLTGDAAGASSFKLVGTSADLSAVLGSLLLTADATAGAPSKVSLSLKARDLLVNGSSDTLTGGSSPKDWDISQSLNFSVTPVTPSISLPEPIKVTLGKTSKLLDIRVSDIDSNVITLGLAASAGSFPFPSDQELSGYNNLTFLKSSDEKQLTAVKGSPAALQAWLNNGISFTAPTQVQNTALTLTLSDDTAGTALQTTVSRNLTLLDNPPPEKGQASDVRTGATNSELLEDSEATAMKSGTIAFSDESGVRPTFVRFLTVDGGSVTSTDGASISLGDQGSLIPITYASNDNSGTIEFSFKPTPNRADDARVRYVVVDPQVPSSNSAPETLTVLIQGVNDAPIVRSARISRSYEEDSSIGFSFARQFSLQDSDSENLRELVLTIESPVSGDRLDIAALPSDLTLSRIGSGLSADSSLKLTGNGASGTATLSSFQTALRAVTFSNSGQDLKSGVKTISISATDDAGSVSNILAASFGVVGKNDNPVFLSPNSNNYSISFTESNAQPKRSNQVLLFPQNNVADLVFDPDFGSDRTSVAIQSASVRITNNYKIGQDFLTLTGSHQTLSGRFNASLGQLFIESITGTGASLNAIEAALEGVAYSNSSSNPDTSPRGLEVTVSDLEGGTFTWSIVGSSSQTGGSSTKGLQVARVNDPPAVDLNGLELSGGNHQLAATIGSLVKLVPSASLGDLDNLLGSTLAVEVDASGGLIGSLKLNANTLAAIRSSGLELRYKESTGAGGLVPATPTFLATSSDKNFSTLEFISPTQAVTHASFETVLRTLDFLPSSTGTEKVFVTYSTPSEDPNTTTASTTASVDVSINVAPFARVDLTTNPSNPPLILSGSPGSADGSFTADLAARVISVGTARINVADLFRAVDIDARGLSAGVNGLLVGTASSNAIFGGPGNDTLVGGGGNDTLKGGTGNDVIRISIQQINQNVSIDGGDGNDVVAGSDRLEIQGPGGAFIKAYWKKLRAIDEVSVFSDAAFSLEGSDASDVLRGGASADTLRGGLGNDSLFGGAGLDVFMFDHADEIGAASVDRIADLHVGDRIVFDKSMAWSTTVPASPESSKVWLDSNAKVLKFRLATGQTGQIELPSLDGIGLVPEGGGKAPLVLVASLLAPSAPDLISSSDSGDSNSDNLTNIGRPELSVGLPLQVSPGSRIEIFAVNGSDRVLVASRLLTSEVLNALDTSRAITLRVGDAAFGDKLGELITATGLSDGSYTLSAGIRFSETAQSALSNPINITIDRTPPQQSAPTPLPRVLSFVDDVFSGNPRQTGTVTISTNPGATDDTTPTFNLITEAGSKLNVLLDGVDQNISLAAVNGQVSWTTSALSTGTHTVQIKATDAAGNSSGWSLPYTVNVILANPEAPSIVAVTDDVGAKKGTLVSGQGTDDATPAFTVSAQAGVQLELIAVTDSRTTPLTTTIQPGPLGNQWVLTPSDPLVAGQYSFKVRAVSEFAQVGGSAESLPFTLLVDNVPPQAPSIKGLRNDSGASSTDLFTKAAELVIDGVEPRSSLVYSLGTTGSGGLTNWSTFSNLYLPLEGENRVKVKQIDEAGNESAESNVFQFVLDRVAPTVSVTSNKQSLKSDETAIITFTISEPSSDFTESDLVFTGGTLTGFGVDPNNNKLFTAVFTPTANTIDALSVSVGSAKFSDAAENFNADGSESNNRVSMLFDRTYDAVEDQPFSFSIPNGARIRDLDLAQWTRTAAGNTKAAFLPQVSYDESQAGTTKFSITNIPQHFNGILSGPSSAGLITINIAAVNDPPTGADKAITVLEDNPYSFSLADFGFSDSADSVAGGSDPNSFSGIKVASIPAAGSLKLNTASGGQSPVWVAVAADQNVAASDISAGRLRFEPLQNASGSEYASFSFAVRDSGGTTNSGVDLDQTPNLIKFSVTSLNDPPSGADKTITMLEDSTYLFGISDFGFNDAADSVSGSSSGNEFAALKITEVAANGALKFNTAASGATANWTSVQLNQEISAADISAGKLRLEPAPNANGAGHASFTFAVKDNGGTANGGLDTDQSPNRITFDVTAVNDAPSGSNTTVTTGEDLPYVLKLENFGFSDPFDQIASSGADTLVKLKITSLPAAGALRFSADSSTWVDVIPNQEVSKAQIENGQLRFEPVANANGLTYATFSFAVQDSGGTANAGKDADESPNTITVAVTARNDAPVLSQDSVVIESVSRGLGGFQTPPTGPYGTTVSQLLQSAGLSDVDAGALRGIAITELGASAPGVLFYSTNNGQAWLPVPSLSPTNEAFSLVSNDQTRLFFKPSSTSVALGPVTSIFKFRAWDQTNLDQNASKVTISAVGDTSAFSTRVTSVNTTITENQPPSLANINASLTFTENDQAARIDDDVAVDDLDAINFGGGSIQVTGLDPSDRVSVAANSTVRLQSDSTTVEYNSLSSGSNWQAVGNLSGGIGNDLVLTLNTLVTPSVAEKIIESLIFTNVDESPTENRTLNVKLNDGAGGVAEVLIAVSVTAVNDAPVNTVPGAQTAQEDTDLSISSIRVADVDATGNITVSLSVAQGTITVASNVSNGLGANAITSNGTGTVTLSGTAAQINATLAASNGVVYRGALNYNGTDTLTVTSNDLGSSGSGASLSDQDTVSLAITAVNDAPTLDTNASPPFSALLGSGNPGASSGVLVSSLTQGVVDVDTGTVPGIAITNVVNTSGSATGVLKYKLSSSSTWQEVGSVSDTAALLLPADARLYFQPSTNSTSGTISNAITFRAWDQSAGVAGNRVTISTTGGSAAYSSNSDTTAVSIATVGSSSLNYGPVTALKSGVAVTYGFASSQVQSAAAFQLNIASSEIDGSYALAASSIGGTLSNWTKLDNTSETSGADVQSGSALAQGWGVGGYDGAAGFNSVQLDQLQVTLVFDRFNSQIATVDVFSVDPVTSSSTVALNFNPNSSSRIPNLVYGTESNDAITGTIGNDTIVALAGTDSINPGAGADGIILGRGAKTIVQAQGQAGIFPLTNGTLKIKTAPATSGDTSAFSTSSFDVISGFGLRGEPSGTSADRLDLPDGAYTAATIYPLLQTLSTTGGVFGLSDFQWAQFRGNYDRVADQFTVKDSGDSTFLIYDPGPNAVPEAVVLVGFVGSFAANNNQGVLEATPY